MQLETCFSDPCSLSKVQDELFSKSELTCLLRPFKDLEYLTSSGKLGNMICFSLLLSWFVKIMLRGAYCNFSGRFSFFFLPCQSHSLFLIAKFLYACCKNHRRNGMKGKSLFLAPTFPKPTPFLLLAICILIRKQHNLLRPKEKGN